MRKQPAHKISSSKPARLARVHARVTLLLVCVFVAPLPSCKRKTVPHSVETTEHEDQPASDQPSATPKPKIRQIMAAWYAVPNESLARRRAAADEFTAAHNRLPLGTRVRVTNPENGKSVIVRITDRGIRDRRVNLDLCKEAAEELGMVSNGFAQMKMEVLPD
jgi:rare lipoprotein A (peptidoglycan hydrolase)